ncbi:MAG: PAS domain S-box protein [Desulfovermiculus sp.]
MMAEAKPSYEQLELRISELEHITRASRAARKLNRLYSRENDRDQLIQNTCDTLCETGAYLNAWIALFDAAGEPITWAEAGWGQDFLPMAEKLIRKESFYCKHRVRRHSGFIVIYDPCFRCADCPLANTFSDRAAMAAALRPEGKTHGLLIVSISKLFATSGEAHSLFQEIAAETAGALHRSSLENTSIYREENFHHSQSFQRLLLETIPIPVFYKDRQGRYLGFNKTFETLFGFAAADLIGKTVFDVYPDELAQIYYAKDRELFEHGEEQVYASQFCAADSTRRDVIFHKAVYTDSQGSICGLIGAILDVTDRNRSEQALHESERNYRSIFENTGTATVILEQDGTISLANRKFALLSGYQKDELEGRKSWEDFVAFASELHWMKKYHDHRRVDPQRVPQEYEYHFRDRKGNVKSISLTVDIIPGTGKSVASLMDITELKQAQKALSEQEKKYRLLAENTADIIWSTDADVKFTYISPSIERILGYSQEEAYEVSIEKRVTPATYEILMEKYHQARTGRLNEALSLELEQFHKDGSVIPTEVNITPLYDQNNVLLGFQGVTRDITFRKQTEQLIVKKQKRLQKLAAKLASAQDKEQRRIADGLHDDVAQLLSACSVKLATLPHNDDPVQKGQILDDIQELINTANEKVHLLSFELSTSTLYKLGLRASIEELCENMGQQYGVYFSFDGHRGSDELNEDHAIVMFKAVRELLFNVVKHAGVKQASVTTSCEDNILKLEVEDHGVGFAKKISNEEYTAGKGLGLFSIQERLRDFGGKMHIESEPGQRTRITLLAPLNIRTQH